MQGDSEFELQMHRLVLEVGTSSTAWVLLVQLGRRVRRHERRLRRRLRLFRDGPPSVRFAANTLLARRKLRCLYLRFDLLFAVRTRMQLIEAQVLMGILPARAFV